MYRAYPQNDRTAVADRRGSARLVARGRERLRAAGRRALALVLACALVLSWVGSARAVCGMTTAAHAAAGHRMGTAMGAGMEVAVAAHTSPRGAAHAPGNDRDCPMRDQRGAPCPALLHCVAVAAAPAMSGLPRGPDAGRATRASAHGPLLGESEAAVEPVAPPPRG
ncbi:hypothetical protein tb265_12500 [Gemmatimonadetes bacterium T265]|nr:hypothetical protein tb265_12500 [Gemmatimonadetes bacterium T265]